MPRGSYYTNDEKEALLKLANYMREKDPNCTYVAIAEMARELKICNRPANGIAQQVAKLLEGGKDAEPQNEQDEVDDLIDIYNNQKLAEKYLELRELAFRTSTLWEKNNKWLKFDVKAICKWLFEHENEMYAARVEELGE